MEITVKKIRKLTLLKIYFIGLFIPLFLFGLTCGVFSFFGYATVTVNGTVTIGLKGLFFGIFLGVGFSLSLTLSLWLLSLFGLWIYSLMSPLKIKFVEYKEPEIGNKFHRG